MLNRLCIVMLCFLIASVYAWVAQAQEHHHEEDELHFSHPLIAESPSPDTKIRFDYFYRKLRTSAGLEAEHTPRVEFEYAFRPDFSIEIDVPYTFRNSDGLPSVNHPDNIGVALKFANFAFKKHHLLLDYGVEFGLPTGSDTKGIGSGHIVEIEPYFGAGIKHKKFEVIGFSSVGFSANKRAGETEANDFNYRFSLLLKPRPGIQPLIELEGVTALNGPERGATVINISPGIKFAPPHNEHWQVGFGVGFPITSTRNFDTRLVLSVFYHFH